MKEADWLVFQLPDLSAKVKPGEVRFHEFIRTPSLSCSVYHVPAGSKEMESAHEEDELYLGLEGRGRLRVGEDDHCVEMSAKAFVRGTAWWVRH